MFMSEVSHIEKNIGKQSSNSKMSVKFSQRMNSKLSVYHKTLNF